MAPTSPNPRTFESLSLRGRQRRLRSVAYDALKRYDLNVEQVSLAGSSFNTIFAVETDRGRRALRVGPDLRVHPDGTEEVEAQWTAQVSAETDLTVPQLHRNRDGEAVTMARADGVPGERPCVLFDWAHGRTLRDRCTEARVREAGRELAVLHEHGERVAGACPAPGTIIGNRVLYFTLPNRLKELRRDYGSLFDEAHCRAQAIVDQLWRDAPHAPHLLHGDYTWANILVTRARSTILDFQDLLWGFEVQDVVIALYAFRQSRKPRELMKLFRAGYETRRSWPEPREHTVVDGLAAARGLLMVNLSLSVRAAGLNEYIDRHATALRTWMGPAT